MTNDSWARVELYRWQHGELPPQDDTCKELDESVAIRAMAEAIECGCKMRKPDLLPSPFNVCVVLRYAAAKLSSK
jgi:hypothetical protein